MRNPSIYVAGYGVRVGSAAVRNLQAVCHAKIVMRTHAELDLAE